MSQGNLQRLPQSASRLESLDALRGIAALSVAILHAAHIYNIGTIFSRAYLAVDIFLVLSGYVLSRGYEHKFAAGMSAGTFLWARIERLWPTMSIGAAIAALNIGDGQGTITHITALFAMLVFFPQTTDRLPYYPSNPPAWSIVGEAGANLAHALILKRLGVPTLAAIVACAGVLLITGAPQSHANFGADAGAGLWVAARVTASYTLGVLMWRVVGDKPLLPSWLGILLLSAAMMSGAILSSPSGNWFDWLFIFVLSPVIVISGIAPLTFGHRILRWLGSISFPLYAVHFPVLVLSHAVGTPHHSGLLAAVLIASAVQIAIPAGKLGESSPGAFGRLTSHLRKTRLGA